MDRLQISRLALVPVSGLEEEMVMGVVPDRAVEASIAGIGRHGQNIGLAVDSSSAEMTGTKKPVARPASSKRKTLRGHYEHDRRSKQYGHHVEP
ncbi:hypothetical protein [Pseudomonas umsongensis]|uniref:Uncharacterized protein n=1 Tax=Pseudomonas umsongensis TaxID=198618 RepID=A0AAE6ZU25_9PSED|nr:hypothetical protein [Pseudomonas umsongensis]QJC78873.1 hypothetical protein HGP31_11310 [Pseudomonas umsongensis]